MQAICSACHTKNLLWSGNECVYFYFDALFWVLTYYSIASSPAFHCSLGPGMQQHMMACEYMMFYLEPTMLLIVVKSYPLWLFAYPCMYWQSLEVRIENKVRSVSKVRKPPAIFSSALDLMVMCCHIPGPSALTLKIGSEATAFWIKYTHSPVMWYQCIYILQGVSSLCLLTPYTHLNSTRVCRFLLWTMCQYSKRQTGKRQVKFTSYIICMCAHVYICNHRAVHILADLVTSSISQLEKLVSLAVSLARAPKRISLE